ncbi:MAG: SIR2 family NAD-dependent protein deacylase [Elusimicrobiota bacterium]
MNKNARKLAQLITGSKKTVFLSGAGVSTNAGIPDFRGENGIYKTGEYDAQKVFDYRYFQKDSFPFFEFARDFLRAIKDIQPTYTHKFIADLEKNNLADVVITQNIDALHQKAGTKNILEIHGSFWKSYCMECSREYAFGEMKEKISSEKIPRCTCGGVIKPDIVFFGEPVKYLKQAKNMAVNSDLFIVIGSSLTVHPAAGLPRYCRGSVAVVNKGKPNFPQDKIAVYENSDLDNFFKEVSECLK